MCVCVCACCAARLRPTDLLIAAGHEAWSCLVAVRFLCRQFENEANAEFHYKTTGQEILNDFEGMKLDYYVLGYGTGGTFAGAGKAIKEGGGQKRRVPL